jgi:uncharacterized protein YdbL (DUF1318 family)
MTTLEERITKMLEIKRVNEEEALKALEIFSKTSSLSDANTALNKLNKLSVDNPQFVLNAFNNLNSSEAIKAKETLEKLARNPVAGKVGEAALSTLAAIDANAAKAAIAVQVQSARSDLDTVEQINFSREDLVKQNAAKARLEKMDRRIVNVAQIEQEAKGPLEMLSKTVSTPESNRNAVTALENLTKLAIAAPQLVSNAYKGLNPEEAIKAKEILEKLAQNPVAGKAGEAALTALAAIDVSAAKNAIAAQVNSAKKDLNVANQINFSKEDLVKQNSAKARLEKMDPRILKVAEVEWKSDALQNRQNAARAPASINNSISPPSTPPIPASHRRGVGQGGYNR